jgi:exosortase D (VPLPA-CTERM-specific)
MNSLRIGVIGVLVEHWGTGMAEGFLHQFQGWVVFMVSTGILFVEIMIFAWMSGRPWREQFGLHTVAPSRNLPFDKESVISRPAWIGLMLMLVTTPVVFAVPKQTEVIPTREFFNSFPLQLDAWHGKRQQMERVYMDGLMLDDYFLADYAATTSEYPVNFYVAWYDSQQAGHSAHSPRSCLPGGGWHINSIEDATIADVGGKPLKVNRVLLQYGDQRQLVYYWFQQRGHVIASEYMVKWYLFWDSLTRHRSDGAMVRVTIPVLEGESIAAAETQLTNFVRAAVPKLVPYVPD